MTLTVRELQVERATRDSVAPFGDLIDIDDTDEALPTAFYEGTVRVVSPSKFVTDDDTDLTVASIDRRELRVQWMERHFKHTQTFIPLQGRPFVVVMAPPTDDDLPDIDQARALLFDGSAGFAMHIGTWHEFPFALVDRTKVIVVIRNEATKSLLKSEVSDGEAQGPDLDKKDIQRRLGIAFSVKL